LILMGSVSHAAEDAPLDSYRKLIRSPDVAALSSAALTLRQWMIAHDPYYPKYHFTGPYSWINDPNGPIYYRGRYHLFYQCKADGQNQLICWGHAVSKDLVHWLDWPVAMSPDIPQDCKGVYSGNTFVADDGSLAAIYTGNVDDRKEAYGILASSNDDGLTWRKQVVMDDKQRPNADSPVHWDGFTWKEGSEWHQLIGGSTGGPGKQGAAWLWTSPDLVHWTRIGNLAPSIKYGPYWELPYLISLSQRQVLMVGAGNPYWVGDYDARKITFTPDNLQPRQVDQGNYYSFNLNMTDNCGPDGKRRQLMHGWVTGPATPTKNVPYWQGAHSIPRVLRLQENRLWQESIPELECLRENRRLITNAADAAGVHGDSLELIATFQPGTAKQFGLNLCVSGDGKEYTRVYFDVPSRTFGMDGPTMKRNAAESKECRVSYSSDSLLPNSSSPVTLHVFLDRSIIEVYVNGVALTGRCFPPTDAQGVGIFSSDGTAELKSLEVFEMKSMWDGTAGDK